MTDLPKWTPGQVVHHNVFGNGRVVDVRGLQVTIRFAQHGTQEIAADYAGLKAGRDPKGSVGLDEAKAALREVLEEYGGTVDCELELLPRFLGGEMILKPSKDGTQSKSVPIEKFFHKITMVREKLRVLEQKINSHPKLDISDRVELQGYITACYGSLTTFNALFSDKAGQFKGQGGKED